MSEQWTPRFVAELPARPDEDADAALPVYPAGAAADVPADGGAGRRSKRSRKAATPLRKTFAPASLPGLLALVLSLAGSAGI